MAAARLPTLGTGGDSGMKSENSKLKQQVEDLRNKVQFLETQMLTKAKSGASSSGVDDEQVQKMKAENQNLQEEVSE